MRAQRWLRSLDARGAERLFSNHPEARLALVRALWPRLVGPGLAGRTEVSSLTGTLLRVRVADGRWMRVLHRLRFRILGRLKGAMGSLAPKQLGFLDGLVPSEDEGPAGADDSWRGDDTSPPPALATAAQSIADPDVRARFLEAAGRYLARARRDL